MADLIEVGGIKEFRKGLKQAGAEWPKELRKAHLAVAKIAERESRRVAINRGGLTAKAAPAISGRATGTEARLEFRRRQTGNLAFTNVAFFGARQRSGWYAWERYSKSTKRQHEPWIGNAWKVAVHGQGPYAVNDALANSEAELYAEFVAAIRRLAREAFPQGK